MGHVVAELVLSMLKADLGEQFLFGNGGGLFEMGFLLPVLGSDLGHEVFARLGWSSVHFENGSVLDLQEDLVKINHWGRVESLRMMIVVLSH